MNFFSKVFKEMRLAPSEITIEALPNEKGFKITLSTDNAAKAVFRSGLNEKGAFEASYFNLIPGRKGNRIRAHGKIYAVEFGEKLRIRSLGDAFWESVEDWTIIL